MDTNISDCDFSGMVTMNNLECSDGRTIIKDAFKHNDGNIVPLVWNHQHDGPYNILGHVLLKNQDKGVRGYAFFNDTESGQQAKNLVKHGDITGLSIYANKLKHKGNNVVHGEIREVSLVLAGANPGAIIDAVNLAHSDDGEIEDAIIFTGEEIMHSVSNAKTDEKQQSANTNNNESTQEDEQMDNTKTVQEIWDGMSDEQKAVANAIAEEAVDQALEDYENDYDDEEGDDMKHNVFEEDYEYDDVLIHDGLNEIFKDGKQYGSLRDSYLAHAEEYGIENIDFLEPDYDELYDVPMFINNQPTGWVNRVINGVHNTPFAKVRMTFADITEDEARAKGYIKGKYKKEEVFKLLKRQVGPTTIYKKQKFDRDDLVDASFDIVPWIRREMDMKLDEEKARAYIFGDGRSSADDDKVNEQCIIPVVSDEDLYSIKYVVTQEENETLEHALISAAVLSQDDYQGSGNTVAFIEAKQVSKMLLMEDKFGHRLYPTLTELASAMGVSSIEKVPSGIVPNGVYGVILDLSDYNVGMKNMGQKNFFDDFDIDYNQSKYLLETRQSGALVKPYSAIVLKANN